MADDKTFTKEQLDKAVADAVAAADVDGLKAKLAEVMDEAKEAKRKLRAAAEIKPEDMAALESENEKLRTDLAAAQKTAKEATATAEKATKALETEQGAARTYALEAEVNGAIAAGNIVPALVPAFKAMIQQQAKADLVDGKYAVTVGDKPASEFVKSFLESEDGKAFKAAGANGGGGAQGGGGQQGSGKTMTRAAFDALDPAGKMTFSKEGGKVVDQAA